MAENRQQLIYNAQRGAAEAWIMAQQYGTYYNASAMAHAMNVLKPDEVPRDINFDQYWEGCGRAVVSAQARLQNPAIYDSISTTQREDKEFLDNVKQIMKEHPRGAEIREHIAQGGYAELRDRQALQEQNSVFKLSQEDIKTLAREQEWEERKHEFHGVSKAPDEIVKGITQHAHTASMVWDEFVDAVHSGHPNPKGLAYGHASSMLKGSKQDMADLVSLWEDAITMAKPEVLSDPDFIECALRYNSNAYAYLPQELQQKEEVIDIMRDVSFCKGVWLHRDTYEGGAQNKHSFIHDNSGAARLCPDNLMYSVKGYEHVAEYLIERQQRLGRPFAYGEHQSSNSALLFLATARQKFPEKAKEFDAAEQRALQTVQQRGRTPHREQPMFSCTLFPEQKTENILFNVEQDAPTAQYFDQYPASLASAMAKLAESMPLAELQQHVDVQKIWQGIGREAQKVELAMANGYTDMEKIRSVPAEHRQFMQTMENIQNSKLPEYVYDFIQQGKDPEKQAVLEQHAQSEKEKKVQASLDAMRSIMKSATVNDTHLRYNAVELCDWMKKFDLDFMEKNLPIKEFWQSVGTTVAKWEKELLTMSPQEKYSPYADSLKSDINKFMNHMYGPHCEFIRQNIKIGRYDAHSQDPQVILHPNGKLEKAPEQQQTQNNKFGFFYGEAAKSQSPKDQQSHGQSRGRDFDDGRTL